MADSATYDALVELSAFPEVAPPPLRGTFWVLGKSYNLPQRNLVLDYYNFNYDNCSLVVESSCRLFVCFVGDICSLLRITFSCLYLLP